MIRRALAGAWLAVAASVAVSAVPEVQPLDFKPSASTRLLVIAPHPDDETLAASGLMRRALEAGGTVHVVVMTSGDAFADGIAIADHKLRPTPFDYRSYGQERERESAAALESIGLPRRDITFLGFPDDGLCLLASKYLNAKVRFESPYTQRLSPPPAEQVIRGVMYRGGDVRRELERLISEFEPTVLAAPHPEDNHPDHCSAYIFVAEALTELERAHRLTTTPRVLHYLIHYSGWPLGTVDPEGEDIGPPAQFPAAEGRWRSLPLTQAEVAAKRHAVDTYHTQMLAIGPFMNAMVRPNELFIEGRPASLPECWCDPNTVATEVPVASRRRPAPRHP